MYQDQELPKPLIPSVFYALLALATKQLHRYGVKHEIHKYSHGSVKISNTNLYRMVEELHARGWIDLIEVRPVTENGKPRHIYAISTHGSIRLQEELMRLDYALTIAKNSHLLDNQTPTDFQRVLADFEVSAQRRQLVP